MISVEYPDLPWKYYFHPSDDAAVGMMVHLTLPWKQ